MKKKYNPNPKEYKRLDCPITWDSKAIEKSADGALTILGYANTKDRDRVGDIVEPKAFQKTLKQYMDNPVLLYMHDWDKVIGKIIHAEVDDKGLKVKAKISGAKDCEDIRTKIKEGILGTFSIGYNELDADWDKESATNYVKELELLEVSVVSIPANPEAKFSPSEEQANQESEEGEKSASDLVQELKTIIKEVEMNKKELEELKAKLRAKSAEEATEEEKTEEVTEEEKTEEVVEEEKGKESDEDEDKEEEEKTEEEVEEEKVEDEGNSQDQEVNVGQVLSGLAEKIDLLSEGMASMIEMFQMMTAEGKGDDMEDDKEDEDKGDDEDKEEDKYSMAEMDEEEEDMDDEEKELESMSDEEGLAVLESLSEELEELED